MELPTKRPRIDSKKPYAAHKKQRKGNQIRFLRNQKIDISSGDDSLVACSKEMHFEATNLAKLTNLLDMQTIRILKRLVIQSEYTNPIA